MNPSTSYDFYVQSYCGNGDFSNWYGPYTFQTLATPSCYYTVEMQDSYGDGWNGASIDVSANGNVVANWGFSNGFVALDSIETFNGDVIDFTFNSGSYDSEITFQITAPDGNITTWGPSPPIGVFLTDTSIAPCQPTTVNVTFQVDMNQVTSTFSLPEVNGTWNSWCGNCNPMTDTDGDGIWEATIPLLSGNYEYKYSADTWTIQEMNDPNASCTNGDPVYTNRTLTVGTSDITIPLVCWGSCSPCLYPPQAPQGITCSSGSPGIIFSDDIDNNSLWNGDIGSGNGYWRINSGGTSSGSTGPLSSHSGNEYLYFETSTGGLDTAIIVSSPINLSSGSLEAELTFWMHAFGSNIGTLRVGASSNANGPFTDLYSWTGQYQANQSDSWVQVGVDLAAYIGQTMYLSFTYERANVGVSYQGDLAIDLIEVTTCQSCVDPSGLAINSITNNSAQITWSNDASINTWNTEFGPVGFNLGNGNVSAVSTNSVDFNNLNVNTSYDFYVQAYCGNGNFSSWVGPFTFQTLPDPGCYYKIAMQDSYGDGWNGASIDVSLNGNNIKNFTCSGFNTIDSVLTYSGSIVDFNFNSGSYDSEISFQITNSQGLQIGSFGPSPATGLFLSDTSISICPSSYAVTLELNSSTIYANGGVIGPNGMYAGGGFLGDAMAVPMIQSTVDTNIWTAVVNVPAGPGPFHYTFLNSPSNGGDWGTKEDLSGLICGDPSNYNDRLLPTITSDTTIQHCFGNCATDGTCIPPVLPANAVTLTLNTSNITNYGTSIGPNGMYVGGGFLGDALAVPMIQSQANPNLWTATVNVVPGSGPNYYIFLNSPTNGGDWAAKEDLSGLSCGDPNNWNDRLLPNITSDTTIQHCFGSCQTDGSCSINCASIPAPYFQNFNSGNLPNCWIQDGNDNFDWTVDAGGTPSSNTGPSDDITGGGYYLYIETSSPRAQGDRAIIYSPTIDLSSLTNPELSFSTHMYGNEIDSLIIDVTTNSGSSYTTIFTKHGDQGNQWNDELVDLSSYSGNVQFRITGTRGVSWAGDITIDDFKVSEATSCNSFATALNAANITTTSADLSWTSGNANSHSLSFDGSSDYVDLGTGLNNVFSTNNWSVSAWIYYNSNNSFNSFFSSGWPVQMYVEGNKIEVYLSSDNSGGSNYLPGANGFNSTSSLTNNTWYHVVFTRDGNNNNIYLNGNLDATSSSTGSVATSTASSMVGSWDGSSLFWDGNIDELGVWNTTLTQSEIQSYMTNPPTANENGLAGYWNFNEGNGTISTDLSSSGINATVNGATWTSDVPANNQSQWNVQYGPSGFFLGYGTTLQNINSTNYSLSGLNSSTSYDYYVQAICSNGDLSYWTGPYSFATLVTCPQPNNLAANNITSNSADLSWTAGGSETSWNIEYGLSGFTQGSGLISNSTSPSHILSGLSSTTFYEYYVQAQCGTNDLSFWTGPFIFNTNCDNEVAPFIDDFNSPTLICWTQNSGDDFDWTLNTGGTGSVATGPSDDVSGGGNYIYIETSSPRQAGDSAIIISSFIDISNLTSAELRFFTHMYGTSINELSIYITDASGLINQIFIKSGDQGDQWNEEIIDLSGYTGLVQFTIIGVAGADSGGTVYRGDIAIDNFEIRANCPPVNTTDIITACESYTWIDGNTYTISNNTATHTLTNATGCDSIVTLDLTINYSNTGTDIITACDIYTWINGNTYIADNNTATHTLTNSYGCDSVVTLNLTINYSKAYTESIIACDSYTWTDGVTYTTSNNTAIQNLSTSLGCDSIVTLDLTINYSNAGIDAITACDNYTWIDGNTYTSSNNTATHTLTNVDGCDSVVTLDLTIYYSNTATDVITGCDNYTWIDGTTYSSSNNTATHTLTNIDGCDSLVTLDLTIYYSNTGTDVITACDNYTWIDGTTYTSSNNTASYTLTNVDGCDSLVTLDLTINYSNTGIDRYYGM